MTHFLRDENNDSVVDADVIGDNDFRVVVCVHPYSKKLLDLAITDFQERRVPPLSHEFILDMAEVQSLRQTWWECVTKKHGETPDKFLARHMRFIGEKWGLFYVTD